MLGIHATFLFATKDLFVLKAPPPIKLPSTVKKPQTQFIWEKKLATE